MRVVVSTESDAAWRTRITRVRKAERAGDVAVIVLAGLASVYEFTFDDVLTYACHRACRKHPLLLRLVIYAIAGHLASDVPYRFDVFDARNVVHRWIVESFRYTRRRIRAEHRDRPPFHLQGA